MNDARLALWRIHRRKIDIPLFLSASFVLLILGLFLPVITLRELVFWKSTFSVISGIQNLFEERYFFLALIILLFSVIFPIFKLVVLSMIWFSSLAQNQRERYIHWLAVLGKWSMLDVFVVAVTIVITKISGLVEAEARIGIYFFGSSILLAMLVTERIERLIRQPS